MALVPQSALQDAAESWGPAPLAMLDEDLDFLLSKEDEMKRRYQGLWELIEPDRAFQAQVTFWQFGQESPMPLLPMTLRGNLQRYLHHAFWPDGSSSLPFMSRRPYWQVTVAQPQEVNGPRSYVANITNLLCRDDDEEGCEFVSLRLWNILLDVSGHPFQSSTDTLTVNTSARLFACFNNGLVGFSMKHPRPSNVVHRGYVRCTFRLFYQNSSAIREDNRLSYVTEIERIEHETRELPEYHVYHEPLILLAGGIQIAHALRPWTEALLTANTSNEDTVYLFERIHYAIGFATMIPEDRIPDIINSYGRKEVEMAARLQFPRLTRYVQDLVRQLKILGEGAREGIQPSGQTVCRLYKALRDVYAIAPSFTMVLRKLKEAAGSGSLLYATLTALLGIGAIVAFGPAGAPFLCATLGGVGVGTGTVALRRGTKWYRARKALLLNNAFDSAVIGGSYFVALSYMRSIGLVDVHTEDHKYTRERLLDSIHAAQSLSDTDAQYIQMNIEKAAKQVEHHYDEFYKGMCKLGFESHGGFRRIMV